MTEFTHTHTDLASGDPRYYRVSALNAPARSSQYSGIVMGRAVEPRGRVDVAFDPAGVSEDGGTATVAVTATTDADAQPAQGFELTVALATEDGTAAAPGDYTALDTTVSFGPGDFRRGDGGRRSALGGDEEGVGGAGRRRDGGGGGGLRGDGGGHQYRGEPVCRGDGPRRGDDRGRRRPGPSR